MYLVIKRTPWERARAHHRHRPRVMQNWNDEPRPPAFGRSRSVRLLANGKSRCNSSMRRRFPSANSADPSLNSLKPYLDRDADGNWQGFVLGPETDRIGREAVLWSRSV